MDLVKGAPPAAGSVRGVTRRTQHERSEETVARLVAAARERFAEDGYAAASLDAIVEAAGLTKGALYHHFTGKRALFRAVYAGEQAKLAAASARAYLARRDPWKAFEAGCQAFFAESLDPGVQRITLLDAPAALGWEEMREVESPALAQMEFGIQRAMDAGRLPRRPPRPLALLLFGAICEAAMQAARTEDPATAQRAMLAELGRMLRALASAAG
jgi:AcrR family transcriptional regulator